MVGPEPTQADPNIWDDAYLAARHEWDIRRGAENSRIRGVVRDAILLWTARPEKPSPVALVQHDEAEPYIRALQEAANSLAQIARWSADPRVRNEAQRMHRRLTG